MICSPIPPLTLLYSHKSHGFARPVSVKSDPIRKHPHREARCVGGSEGMPSANPGAGCHMSTVTGGIVDRQQAPLPRFHHTDVVRGVLVMIAKFYPKGAIQHLSGSTRPLALAILIIYRKTPDPVEPSPPLERWRTSTGRFDV